MTDATGDLDRADFQAVAGNLAKTLFAGAVQGAYREIEAVFTLPAGDWGFAMKVADLSGRQIESALTPVGGGASVILRVRPAGYNVVANPVINSITPTPQQYGQGSPQHVHGRGDPLLPGHGHWGGTWGILEHLDGRRRDREALSDPYLRHQGWHG